MTNPEELAQRLDQPSSDGLLNALLREAATMIRAQAARVAELECGINGLNETGLRVIDERDALRAQIAEMRQDTDKAINTLRAQLESERREADAAIDRQAEEFAKARGMLDERDQLAAQPQPAEDSVDADRLLKETATFLWGTMAESVLHTIAQLIQSQQRERDAQADMFWDDADPDATGHDVADILDNYTPGEIVRINQALRMHDVFAVRVGNEVRSFDTSEEAEAWADEREAATHSQDGGPDVQG